MNRKTDISVSYVQTSSRLSETETKTKTETTPKIQVSRLHVTNLTLDEKTFMTAESYSPFDCLQPFTNAVS